MTWSERAGGGGPCHRQPGAFIDGCMNGMADTNPEHLYTKQEVDAAVAEALRRVRRELQLWKRGDCVGHVDKVTDELGVTIPDE